MDNKKIPGEDHDSEPIIIVLNDEDGNDVEFEFLDLIEYNQEEYVALLPLGDDSVVILKVLTGEDGETVDYIGIDDEKLLVALFDIFKEKNADVFEFDNG